MGRRNQYLHNDRIIPISIRDDLLVQIQDIPHDMTKAEANKICRVVIAMAGGDDNEETD